jgi:hypothetical protein
LVHQLFQVVFITLLRHYQLIVFKRSLHYGFYLAKIKRLHKVIEGPQSQRTNRALDSLHAANHHYDAVGRQTLRAGQHFQAAHSGHGNVADY